MRHRSVSRSDSDLAMRACDILDDNAKLEVNSMDDDDTAHKKKTSFFSKVFGRNKQHGPFNPRAGGVVIGTKGKDKADLAPETVAVEEGEMVSEDEALDEITANLKAQAVARAKSNEPLIISCLDDLPDHFKESIRQGHIDESELRNDPNNLFVALSCLHFFSKQAFIFNLPGENQPRDLSKVLLQPV